MRLLALLAAVVFWSPQAQGTTMVQLDVEAQVQLSSAVVEGRVAHQRVLVSEQTGNPNTLSWIEVERVHHGAAPATLVLRQFGGPLGEMRAGISGDATLSEGDRVVLFVRRGVEPGDLGFWFLTALGQSAFHVLGNGPEARVVRDAGGMDLLVPAPDGTLQPADSSPDAPLDTLADLREAIAALGGGGP